MTDPRWAEQKIIKIKKERKERKRKGINEKETRAEERIRGSKLIY